MNKRSYWKNYNKLRKNSLKLSKWLCKLIGIIIQNKNNKFNPISSISCMIIEDIKLKNTEMIHHHLDMTGIPGILSRFLLPIGEI